MAELSETERRWRTLMVAAVALAYPLGQTGFELGAYGELLFEHKLAAWTAVTATLIVFAVLPKQFVPVPRWHMWFLAIPSLWAAGCGQDCDDKRGKPLTTVSERFHKDTAPSKR